MTKIALTPSFRVNRFVISVRMSEGTPDTARPEHRQPNPHRIGDIGLSRPSRGLRVKFSENPKLLALYLARPRAVLLSRWQWLSPPLPGR